MPASLNGSVIAAERAIACTLTHDRALDLRARKPDVFELAVAHRLQMGERRLLRAPSDEGGKELGAAASMPSMLLPAVLARVVFEIVL